MRIAGGACYNTVMKMGLEEPVLPSSSGRAHVRSWRTFVPSVVTYRGGLACGGQRETKPFHAKTKPISHVADCERKALPGMSPRRISQTKLGLDNVARISKGRHLAWLDGESEVVVRRLETHGRADGEVCPPEADAPNMTGWTARSRDPRRTITTRQHSTAANIRGRLFPPAAGCCGSPSRCEAEYLAALTCWLDGADGEGKTGNERPKPI
jgi:hypothetical protein